MDLTNGISQEQRQEPWTDYSASGYSQSQLFNYLHPAYQYALRLSSAARYLIENYSYLTAPSLLEALLAGQKAVGLSGLSTVDQLVGNASLKQTISNLPYNNSIGERRPTEIGEHLPNKTMGHNWANAPSLLSLVTLSQNQSHNCHTGQDESVQIVKIEEIDQPLVVTRRPLPTARPALPQKKSSARLRPVADIVASTVLSKAERQAKIDLYREKRKRRIFSKKVSYDCRKKVADQRIRIKGRFVTKTQALELLALSDDELTIDRIKVLLRQRTSQGGSVAADGNSFPTNFKLQ